MYDLHTVADMLQNPYSPALQTMLKARQMSPDQITVGLVHMDGTMLQHSKSA